MTRYSHRAWAVSLLLVAALCANMTGADEVTISFDGAAVGSIPGGFRLVSSVGSTKGDWRVTRLGELQVLTQHAVDGRGYRLAALEAPPLDHVRVGVRLRLAERGDGAAGIAWRVQNADNYYAARLDLKEREFVLHKFVNGNRIRLSRLERLRLDASAWHEIVVQHAGDTIRAWLNGIPVAAERDRSPRTPGLIALWMPADSSCHFLRLWYEPLRTD